MILHLKSVKATSCWEGKKERTVVLKLLSGKILNPVLGI